MYPHRIRLRGPWECAELGSSAPPRRVTVPCRPHEAGFAQDVLLTRKFGYPGQIDAFERVWLTFAGIQGTASIALNDTRLGTAAKACAFDVTELLRPHNRLDVAFSADPAGFLGEVALEVRCAVFLTNVRIVRATSGLAVAGELCGSWPEPFDLYVFADGEQVDYQSIQTQGNVTPFQAVLPGREPAIVPSQVRVDLIQGPRLWSSVEATFQR